jgi:superfamily II DNA/RNA helicase
VLDQFSDWVADKNLEPYPAQEEAFLELLADRHVILATPTGSGKTLVATFLHWKAMCEGQRSFYTAPTKALVSEKFFALCEDFGPESVGMLTGDVSINPEAPIICCTTEVLASMALRSGERTLAPYVVMDEFHYYADPARGSAWQVPLIALPHSLFLMMSATLGDTGDIAARVRARSGREVASIYSDERPVPLDYEYRETPVHETVESLLEHGKAPIYIVHFTQRDAADQAQALTSARISTREERVVIRAAIGDAVLDSPYGKELRRLLGFGVGVHHAGLLPRYRLLVEQLAQRGLLKVICGTDTLGVGVNIPIRTVLFSRLFKFDGRKTALLGVRDFQQIAGRAGRKGFDERGSVVCQAPPHVIENKRAAQRAPQRGRKRKPRSVSPPRNYVAWSKQTMERLIHSMPPALVPQFRVSHGLLVNVLQRDPKGDAATGYQALISLIDDSHQSQPKRHRMRREAAVIFRSLRGADVLRIERDPLTRRQQVRISSDLQQNFSLDQTLSLYLVEAVSALAPDEPDYAVDVLSLVESILEDPRALLYRQEDRIKRELMDQLKAERVPFEERIRLLDGVSWPRPNAEFIYATFNLFVEKHPWVGRENIRPKGIAREIFESYSSFSDYVRLYGLARSEGLLLRYLGDVFRTLSKTVPEWAVNEELEEVLVFFRSMLPGVDSALLDEWQGLLGGAVAGAPSAPAPTVVDICADERQLRARVRAELHRLVRALSERDYGAAARFSFQDPSDPWDGRRFARALEPFHAEHEKLVFDHAARLSEHTQIIKDGPRRFRVQQVLLDPSRDNDWVLAGEVDLTDRLNPSGPIVRVTRIER